MGSENQALAGTGAALGPADAAAYSNPALLGGASEQQLTLGYQAARFAIELRPASGGAQQSLDDPALQGYQVALVLPLPLHAALERRLALGLSGFLPGDSLARVHLLRNGTPQYPLLADRVHSLSFALGVGAELGAGFRLGAGLLFLASLSGDVVADQDAQGQLQTRVDDRVKLVTAPLLGAAYRTGSLYLGLVYREVLHSDFDVRVEANDLGSLILPELHLAGAAQYDPRQLQLEAAWQFASMRVILSLLYRNWASFDGILDDTLRCPSEHPNCTAAARQRPRFVDTLSPRLAAAQRLRLSATAWAELRAGVFYEPSPLAEQGDASGLLDSSRLVLTAGYGLEVLRDVLPMRMDLALQHHQLLGRTLGAWRATGNAQSVSLSLGVTF